MMSNLHIVFIARAPWCVFLFTERYKNIWRALIRWGASVSLPAGLSKLEVQVGSVYEVHVKTLENSPSLIKENRPEAWSDIKFWQGRLSMEKRKTCENMTHRGIYKLARGLTTYFRWVSWDASKNWKQLRTTTHHWSNKSSVCVEDTVKKMLMSIQSMGKTEKI